MARNRIIFKSVLIFSLVFFALFNSFSTTPAEAFSFWNPFSNIVNNLTANQTKKTEKPKIISSNNSKKNNSKKVLGTKNSLYYGRIYGWGILIPCHMPDGFIIPATQKDCVFVNNFWSSHSPSNSPPSNNSSNQSNSNSSSNPNPSNPTPNIEATPTPIPTTTPTPTISPTPTPTPPVSIFTKEHANSYDDPWQADWVANAKSILSGGANKTPGFVLEIGDSITRAGGYAAWPRYGQGKTSEDAQILDWVKATAWSSTLDATNKNGFYLSAANITIPKRSFTASGGITINGILTGSGNGGPDMPAVLDPVLARQTLIDNTYVGNLQIDTIIAAFPDAQFAVVMLGTNSVADNNNIVNLSIIVDKLEAAHIVPILSTIPPRGDNSALNKYVDSLNESIITLAKNRALPLIDFHQEILNRRPGTSWLGTLINTTDGVHPTSSGAGFSTDSDPYLPGGDPATYTTGDSILNVGFLLRSWLTVQKIKEVKADVIN